ncbi:MAG: hypothetical protein HY670_06365 [Chloroflexi bacterium]|nr:hypothetical protein [Chloroflexota bacterium]
MAKEIERAGITTVLIAGLPEIARNIGVTRILKGHAVTAPTGNPDLSLDEEKMLRRKITETALKLLTTEVAEQLVVMKY